MLNPTALLATSGAANYLHLAPAILMGSALIGQLNAQQLNDPRHRFKRQVAAENSGEGGPLSASHSRSNHHFDGHADEQELEARLIQRAIVNFPSNYSQAEAEQQKVPKQQQQQQEEKTKSLARKLSSRDIKQNDYETQKLLLNHHRKDANFKVEPMMMSETEDGYYVVNNITLKVSFAFLRLVLAKIKANAKQKQSDRIFLFLQISKLILN